MPLHRIHFGTEQRKQSRHVAGTGADLEDAIIGLKSEVFEHRSHDVRLRDGLPLADGQRMIAVGVQPEGLRDKLMPRHSAHGVEHSKVANSALGELRADHFFGLLPRRIGLEGEGHGFVCCGLDGRMRPSLRVSLQYGPMIPPMLRATGGSDRAFFSFFSCAWIMSRYL